MENGYRRCHDGSASVTGHPWSPSHFEVAVSWAATDRRFWALTSYWQGLGSRGSGRCNDALNGPHKNGGPEPRKGIPAGRYWAIHTWEPSRFGASREEELQTGKDANFHISCQLGVQGPWPRELRMRCPSRLLPFGKRAVTGSNMCLYLKCRHPVSDLVEQTPGAW